MIFGFWFLVLGLFLIILGGQIRDEYWFWFGGSVFLCDSLWFFYLILGDNKQNKRPTRTDVK